MLSLFLSLSIFSQSAVSDEVIAEVEVLDSSMVLEVTTDRVEVDFVPISMEVREHFDPLFPLNVKDFYFTQGEKKLSLEDIYAITKDPLLEKNNEKIAKVKRGGLAAAAILGCTSATFFIPSMVFIIMQTNYYNIKRMQIEDLDNNTKYSSWLSYFEDNYYNIFLPSVLSIIFTGLTSMAMFIDLAVTFGLIQKYKYNQQLYRIVIDRYNQKNAKKISFQPLAGYDPFYTESIFLGFKLNI